MQDIHEKLLHNMDQSLTSCAIFLDLSKAFDTVSHSILLKKLQKYGVRGQVFKLLESYLTARTQFVEIDNVRSMPIQIKYGVPQGSILGPLLFLIYINDLPSATNCFIKLFADDTFLCTQNKDMKSLEIETNYELKKVNIWLASNKLTLNIKKSKFMVFTNKRKDYHEILLKINGKAIERCTSYKYLGIVIDDKLKWNVHIDYICKKISKGCGALAKMRHCASLELLREIYYALIFSYIRYGITTWGNASESIIHPLEILNHRAARIMTFAPFGRIDISPLLNYLEILDIKDIYFLETAKLTFKLKKDLIPVAFGNYFGTGNAAASHTYNLRRRGNNINTMKYKTSYGQRSLQYRVTEIWNNIPPALHRCETVANFKKKLKSHLLESQDTEGAVSL